MKKKKLQKLPNEHSSRAPSAWRTEQRYHTSIFSTALSRGFHLSLQPDSWQAQKSSMGHHLMRLTQSDNVSTEDFYSNAKFSNTWGSCSSLCHTALIHMLKSHKTVTEKSSGVRARSDLETHRSSSEASCRALLGGREEADLLLSHSPKSTVKCLRFRSMKQHLPSICGDYARS